MLEEHESESRQQVLFDAAMSRSDRLVNRFKGMIRNADVGIVDLRVVSDELSEDTRRLRSRRIELISCGRTPVARANSKYSRRTLALSIIFAHCFGVM